MLFLAAAAAATTAAQPAVEKLTPLEKLKRVPPEFWWKIGLCMLVVIATVIVFRKLAGTNKVVMAVVAFVIFTVVGVNWIYERNEPAFLTPVIDKIAPFLPSKGAYATKQQQAPLPPAPAGKPQPPPKKN